MGGGGGERLLAGYRLLKLVHHKGVLWVIPLILPRTTLTVFTVIDEMECACA